MTLETFSALVKRARRHREQTSDHALSFGDVESRLAFDRAAERLLLSCMMMRYGKRSSWKAN